MQRFEDLDMHHVNSEVNEVLDCANNIGRVIVEDYLWARKYNI